MAATTGTLHEATGTLPGFARLCSSQTRVVGLLCRVGCAESVSADVRLRVASTFVAVVARPWGPLEVCFRGFSRTQLWVPLKMLFSSPFASRTPHMNPSRIFLVLKTFHLPSSMKKINPRNDGDRTPTTAPPQSRKEFREGVERKTLSFACFALGHLVATSASIRGSIAHRSRLFDTLVSALRPRMAAATASSGGGGGIGGGLGPGGSPPQAVACAAFCLAHVTTGESAALITRWRLLSACSTLAGLLDTCINQMEAAAASPRECGGAPGSGDTGPGSTPRGDARGAASAGGGSLAATMVMESAGTALWGCLSHLPGD